MVSSEKKTDGWYVKKKFPHFDLPLPFEQAKRLVKDKKAVEQHPFLPFLGYTDSKRRFTPKLPKKFKKKDRNLRYCSHRDGYIHAYYARKLVDDYEAYLAKTTWGSNVIGYRAGIGTNIHMAKNAFAEISKRKDCIALAIDISDFFGSIDHDILLRNLKKVLNTDRLSKDWFKVFKSMTRYSWVDHDQLQKTLGFDRKNPPRPLCDLAKYRELRRSDKSLVQTNRDSHGIPQGSPISAVFSNVFMIEFDKLMSEFVKGRGGFYRRYSDDIFIVCDREEESGITDYLNEAILVLGNTISISEEKTERSEFRSGDDKTVSCDKPITYLGFSFDGVTVELRARTLSRYYRRMTYATRRAARDARASKSPKTFKRKLYRQFTHLGQRNFYSYAKRASEIFHDETPKRQLRRHFRVLSRKLGNRGK